MQLGQERAKYGIGERSLPLPSMRFTFWQAGVLLTDLLLSLPFHLDAVKILLLAHNSTTSIGE